MSVCFDLESQIITSFASFSDCIHFNTLFPCKNAKIIIVIEYNSLHLQHQSYRIVGRLTKFMI